MNEQCPICKSFFDFDYRPPFVACSNQHAACRFCFSEQEIRVVSTALHKELSSEKEQMISTLFELAEFGGAASLQETYLGIREFAVDSMKANEFESAALILQKLIEVSLPQAEKECFLGLGMWLQEEGYYENKGYDWYEEQFGESISLFDLLNVCFLKHNADYSEKHEWFSRMHTENPLSFPLLFGLAVSQMNAEQFDLALELFDKLIEMNAEFGKLYLAKSLIYFETRSQSKTLENALLFQEREPEDITLKFLLADNNSAPARVCSNLRGVLSEEPSFVKALFHIGVQMFNFEDKEEEEVKIYEECIRKNENYIDAQVWFAMAKYQEDQYEIAFEIFVYVLNQKPLSRSQRFVCLQHIGLINAHYRQFATALRFYAMAEQLQKIQQRLSYLHCKIRAYVKLAMHQEAVKEGRAYINVLTVQLNETTGDRSQLYNHLFDICLYVASAYFAQKKYADLIKFLRQWEDFPEYRRKQYFRFMEKMEKHFAMELHKEDCKNWYESCKDQKYHLQSSCLKFAVVLHKRKEYAEAIAVLNETISILPPPEHRKAKEYRAKLVKEVQTVLYKIQYSNERIERDQTNLVL